MHDLPIALQVKRCASKGNEQHWAKPCSRKGKALGSAAVTQSMALSISSWVKPQVGCSLHMVLLPSHRGWGWGQRHSVQGPSQCWLWWQMLSSSSCTASHRDVKPLWPGLGLALYGLSLEDRPARAPIKHTLGPEHPLGSLAHLSREQMLGRA